MAINVFDQALRGFDGSESWTLRRAKFTHLFRKDGVVAVWHSLTHQVIYFPEEAIISVLENDPAGLTKLPLAVVKKLVENGFLVSQGYDEQGVLDQIREQFLSRPSFSILYLLLTDACNLRCKYCVIEGTMPSGHKFLTMSKEVADQGIELFVQLWNHSTPTAPRDRRRRATVIFYGGEPLLNKGVFLYAVDRIDDLRQQELLPRKTRIALITNGTVVDDDLIECWKQHNISVSFSIDGPASVHDHNRVTVGNQGTFEQVISNLRRCQERGVFPSISCTINPANLDQLPQIMEWFVDELGVSSMGMNLLLDLPGYLRMDSLEYATQATQQLIEGYKVARQRGIYEDRMMRKIKAFVGKQLHLVDCGGCGSQIVVTPEGRVGPCHMYMPTQKYLPATVWEKDYNYFGSDLFLEWTKRSPINMPGCLTCPALGSCGGGCLYNAEVKCRDIWKPDPGFCIHSKMVLEWLIWDLLEHERQVQARPANLQEGGE